jgi:hypothetical protein
VLADFANTTGEPVFDAALKVALAVALEQSPFLKVFSDQRVQDTLRLMKLPPDQHVTTATDTPARATWTCPRCGAAMIIGPILSALHLATVTWSFDTS